MAYKRCKVESCDLKTVALGFCNVHYQRSIRGMPLDGNPKRTVMERILSKIKKEHNGCWLWTGAKAGGVTSRPYHKYGYIRIDGKTKKVSRVLYEMVTGIDLDGYCLCHRCDNPLCVNPDHMFMGSHTDNMRDMISKGRSVHAVGEANHSKLTENQVFELIEMRRGGVSYKDLGEKFGVHPMTARNIVLGKKWKHINRRDET